MNQSSGATAFRSKQNGFFFVARHYRNISLCASQWRGQLVLGTLGKRSDDLSANIHLRRTGCENKPDHFVPGRLRPRCGAGPPEQMASWHVLLINLGIGQK